MKRILFGAVIALALTSCGGEAAVEEIENPIDSVAVMELENATMDVEKGLQDLEKNVSNLNSDVDSLLNGI